MNKRQLSIISWNNVMIICALRVLFIIKSSKRPSLQHHATAMVTTYFYDQ